MAKKRVKKKPVSRKSRERKIEVEYVAISSLKPWRGNPRKNEVGVDSIVKSIEKFGYTNPVLVRRSNREIIAGHTRVEAMKKLGAHEVPAIFLDLGADDSHLLAVFDNKSVENTPWDFGKLTDAFVDFDARNLDIEMTGFSSEEIGRLIHSVDEGFGHGDRRAEVEFAREVLEENNYVVLVFDSTLDWQVAQEKLGIKPVKTQDSKGSKYHRQGVGRVIDGKKVLKRIK